MVERVLGFDRSLEDGLGYPLTGMPPPKGITTWPSAAEASTTTLPTTYVQARQGGGGWAETWCCCWGGKALWCTSERLNRWAELDGQLARRRLEEAWAEPDAWWGPQGEGARKAQAALEGSSRWAARQPSAAAGGDEDKAAMGGGL